MYSHDFIFHGARFFPSLWYSLWHLNIANIFWLLIFCLLRGSFHTVFLNEGEQQQKCSVGKNNEKMCVSDDSENDYTDVEILSICGQYKRRTTSIVYYHFWHRKASFSYHTTHSSIAISFPPLPIDGPPFRCSHNSNGSWTSDTQALKGVRTHTLYLPLLRVVYCLRIGESE